MAKCNDCKYCIENVDGDEESFGGHACVSNVSYWLECDKGYGRKFKLNGETDCKGFKPRKQN